MILIHRGKGAAVILLGGVLSALVMNIVTNAVFDNEYYGAHIWPKFGTFFLAGLICILVGIYIRKHPSKVRNKDWYEGEAADHFFFVPVIYWGPIFFMVGIAYVVYSFYSKGQHP